jgi:hypothetical protein
MQGCSHLDDAKKLLAPWAAADILAGLPFSEGLFLLLRERFMSSSVLAELDFIEELRLRRWARENYVPRGERKHTWHPVIREEMEKKDVETGTPSTTPAYVWSER